jgi:hypothetical protein
MSEFTDAERAQIHAEIDWILRIAAAQSLKRPPSYCEHPGTLRKRYEEIDREAARGR